ncbi:hypothetical protein MTO96_048521 [Rhipicephalus appendiculatus]
MSRSLQGFFGSMALLAPHAQKVRASAVAKRMASHLDGQLRAARKRECRSRDSASSSTFCSSLRKAKLQKLRPRAEPDPRPAHASESCFVKEEGSYPRPQLWPQIARVRQESCVDLAGREVSGR